MVQWCLRQRRPWLAIVLLGCAVLLLLSASRRSTTDTEATRERDLFCRPDMEVNKLPPMSADDNTMFSDLFTYLTRPNDNACRKILKFGGMPTTLLRNRTVPLVDGHKFVCLDAEFSLWTADECLVYSFGISDEWSFDWDMESFGCRVFAFDPTMDTATGSQNGTIFFFQLGIGGEDGRLVQDNMELRTLDTISHSLGHTNSTIHYLKMDVDDSEWGVFHQQAERGSESTLFRNVEQLGVELHFMYSHSVQSQVQFYRQAYRSFLRLQEMGFYLFAYEPNVQSPPLQVPGFEEIRSAMEVVWLKSRCVGPATSRQQLPSG